MQMGEMSGRLLWTYVCILTFTVCISDTDHHHDILPHPDQFINAIYQRFANNETNTIDMNGLKEILNILKIGKKADSHDHEHHEAHTDDHEEEHEHHEDGLTVHSPGGAVVQDDHHHDHNMTDVNHNCYTADHYFDLHSINVTTGITRPEFHVMSTSFVQQLLFSSCAATPKPSTDEKITTAEKYGYGTLVVLVITLLTLPGAIMATFRERPFFPYLLNLMLGLAIGALVGDAILHLLPTAMGLHNHDEHSHGSGVHVPAYLWKMLALVGSVYAFYLLELALTQLSIHSNKESGTKDIVLNKISPTNGKDNLAYDYTEGETKIVQNGKHNPDQEVATKVEAPSNENCSPLALMVLIGDGVHNFADGLAIGAAFAVGWKSGLSTSIAIALHELPHELGDFAALLSVGWKVKKAMIMNLLSGVSAFAGLYIGIPISNNVEARSWIFAIAAGMFLYVALCELIPEVVEAFKERNNVAMFVSQNVGILIGVGLMLIIAIFEDKIKIT